MHTCVLDEIRQEVDDVDVCSVGQTRAKLPGQHVAFAVLIAGEVVVYGYEEHMDAACVGSRAEFPDCFRHDRELAIGVTGV